VIGLVALIGQNGSVRQQEPASFAAAHPIGHVRRQKIVRLPVLPISPVC
jgi:hypothetical protein